MKREQGSTSRTLGGRNRLARVGLTALIATSSLALGASSASATVTIGQLAPPNPPNTCSGGLSDIVQPTVTSGNSYEVKGDGTIIAWSTSAQTGPTQQMKLKVFRKIADPATYEAVGQDIFRPLASAVVNDFSVNIPVKAGDVIGNNRTGSVNCVFAAPGETFLISTFTDLANGAQANFNSQLGFRANISAVIEPSNAFELGAVTRNKKKGTANITVTVPGPGELSVSGKGVKAAGSAGAQAAATAGGPGQVLLPIRAKGAKKQKLNDTGKVKLKLAITYTPTGGNPRATSAKLKLKKNL
jgi:hypothetical protein